LAILNKLQKPFIDDRDTNIFVGLDFPLGPSNGADGRFKATTTTIEATKVNIKNLLSTELGERLYHPDYGIGLRKFLFEQFTEEVPMEIKDSITAAFASWLPFVEVINIDVKMSESSDNISYNSLEVNIDFKILNTATGMESVSLEIGE
jgi:phage baseplate assembly protein W